MPNIHRVTRLLGALAGCVMGAASAGAEDWLLDFSDSGAADWIEAASEQEKAGYLEAEKIAVGCSLGGTLYVKRYSPAGYSEVSAVRFDAGPEVLIRWDRLDGPNTMWAHGAVAQLLLDRLRSSQEASFREIGRHPRAPVTFRLAGAAWATGAAAAACGVPRPAM